VAEVRTSGGSPASRTDPESRHPRKASRTEAARARDPEPDCVSVTGHFALASHHLRDCEQRAFEYISDRPAGDPGNV